MLPLAFWCLEAYFVTEHKEKRLFYGWYLPAMLFTMIVQYATNTGIVTLSVAYGMCSCVGLIFVADWVQEEKQRWQHGGQWWKGETVPGGIALYSRCAADTVCGHLLAADDL